MFFWLEIIFTGVFIYACLNFENKKGIVGLIFRNPVITSFLIGIGIFVSSMVSSYVNIMSMINTGEVSITGIKVVGYIFFIGISLIVTLLISKFAKNRVINEDKSVSIVSKNVNFKNKEGMVFFILLLFMIVMNVSAIGKNIDKNEVEAQFKELAQKYKVIINN